jgi:hypothetical protein
MKEGLASNRCWQAQSCFFYFRQLLLLASVHSLQSIEFSQVTSNLSQAKPGVCFRVCCLRLDHVEHTRQSVFRQLEESIVVNSWVPTCA